MRAGPQEFFESLCARALARGKKAPELVEVVPRIGQGWVLRFRAGAVPELVEINVDLDEDEAGGALSFSYRTPRAPETRAVLERVGLQLSRLLERVHDGSVPAVEAEASIDEREAVSVFLSGECDRACVFCSKSLVAERLTTEAGEARVASLPIVTPDAAAEQGRAAEERELISTRLRDLAPRAEQIMICWTGKDTLGSPRFDESLRLAHELGFRAMNLQSPGSRLVEPGFVDFLVAHSVTGVSLTAHAADEEVFDRVGGKVGAYQMFWAGFEALREAGIFVNLEVPIVAETVDDLPRHLETLAAYPCSIGCFYWYPQGVALADDLHGVGVPIERALDALDRARAHLPSRRVEVGGVPQCAASEALLDHYLWNYLHHIRGERFVRVEACRGCACAGACPGLPIVYGRHRRWPALSPVAEAHESGPMSPPHQSGPIEN